MESLTAVGGKDLLDLRTLRRWAVRYRVHLGRAEPSRAPFEMSEMDFDVICFQVVWGKVSKRKPFAPAAALDHRQTTESEEHPGSEWFFTLEVGAAAS